MLMVCFPRAMKTVFRCDASKLGIQPRTNEGNRKLAFSGYGPVPNTWQTSSRLIFTVTL